MSVAAAGALWSALGLYLAAGAVFALYFVSRGAGRLDETAATMPFAVRCVIFPASMALWPLLAMRMLSREKKQ